MDFNADAAFEKALADLCDKNYKIGIPEWKYWKLLTERMLRYMPVAEVINNVTNIAEIISDEDWARGYPNEIFSIEDKVTWVGKKIKVKDKEIPISIIALAKKFGLKVRNNKALCPFHKDTDASLVFYPKTNSFFCFGKCRTGGDIVEFKRKMMEVEDGKQKTS